MDHALYFRHTHERYHASEVGKLAYSLTPVYVGEDQTYDKGCWENVHLLLVEETGVANQLLQGKRGECMN